MRMRTWWLVVVVLVVGLAGCGDEPAGVQPEDCGSEEVFVEDACKQCGNAGGCAEREPACLPACDTRSDCASPVCREGACRRGCD